MKQSNALWPDDVYSGMYGDHISTDTHIDFESAHAVCIMLQREGFGGMRKQFPLKTWVSDIQQPPVIPEMKDFKLKSVKINEQLSKLAKVSLI